MSKNKSKTPQQTTLAMEPQVTNKKFRTWTFEVPQPAVYENPEYNVKLNFTDRLNTSYVVEKEPLAIYDDKDTTTYKDYIVRQLDPNLEENKKVYGMAKPKEPLTKRINRMKFNIDEQTNKLNEYKAALSEYIKSKQQEIKKDKQDQPKEEAKNVQNE